eukprot:gene10008-881_t
MSNDLLHNWGGGIYMALAEHVCRGVPEGSRDAVDKRLEALPSFRGQMSFTYWPWSMGRSTHTRFRHLLRVAAPVLLGMVPADVLVVCVEAAASGEYLRREKWTPSDLARLTAQQKRLIDAWATAFGSAAVLPKLHWTLHDPELIEEQGAPIHSAMDRFEKTNQHVIGEAYRESSRKGGLLALSVQLLKWSRQVSVGIASVAEGNELSAPSDSEGDGDGDDDGDAATRPRRTTKVSLDPASKAAVLTLEAALGRPLYVAVDVGCAAVRSVVVHGHRFYGSVGAGSCAELKDGRLLRIGLLLPAGPDVVVVGRHLRETDFPAYIAPERVRRAFDRHGWEVVQQGATVAVLANELVIPVF